jgi:hypothetical protein
LSNPIHFLSALSFRATIGNAKIALFLFFVLFLGQCIAAELKLSSELRRLSQRVEPGRHHGVNGTQPARIVPAAAHGGGAASFLPIGQFGIERFAAKFKYKW